MRDKDGLNPKQRQFVDEYLLDPTSGAKAAIRAGYAVKYVHEKASELMHHPKIKAVIEREQAKRAEKLGITKERVLQELALIAFSTMDEAITVGGQDEINLKDLKESPTPTEVIITTVRGNKPSKSITVKSIKLSDKLAALEKLGKHLGMFKDQVEHSGHMTLEQLVEDSMGSETETEEVDASS